MSTDVQEPSKTKDPSDEGLDKIANPQAAFKRLTSKVWGVTDKSFIQFRPDGTYHWKVTANIGSFQCPVGIPHFDREGKWTFQWKDDHGLVGLETGDCMAIAFRQQQLYFQSKLLPAAKDVKHSAGMKDRSYQDLDALKTPDLVERLSRHGWRKSDRFNMFMYPTKVRFDKFGRFVAEYRDGECGAGGFWSLTDKATILRLTPDSNQCDQRGNSTASIGEDNSKPIFKHDMLIFVGVSYFPENHPRQVNAFTFDRYSKSVRTTAWYSGELRKGEAKKLTLHFENMSRIPKQLEKLTITLERYSVINGRPEKSAGKSTLLDLKLDTVLLESGGEHTKTVEITPNESGEVMLTFNIDYRDSIQEYHGYNNFFGEVTEAEQ